MTADPTRWLDDPDLEGDLRAWLSAAEPTSSLPDHVSRKVERRLAMSLLALPLSIKALGVAKGSAAASTSSGSLLSSVGAAGTGTAVASSTAASAAASAGMGMAGVAATTSVSLLPGLGAATSTASLGATLLGALSTAKVLGIVGVVVAASSATGYLVVRDPSGSVPDGQVDDLPSASAGRAEHETDRLGRRGTTPGSTGPDRRTARGSLATLPSEQGTEAASSLQIRRDVPLLAAGVGRSKHELGGQVGGARQPEHGGRSAPPADGAASPSGSPLGTGSTPAGRELDLDDLETTARTSAGSRDDTPNKRSSADAGQGSLRGDVYVSSGSAQRQGSSKQGDAALREEVRLLKSARLMMHTDPTQARQILRLYRQRFPHGSLETEYESLLSRLKE